MRNRIGQLRMLYDEFNDEYFGGKLQSITLLIKRNQTKDGWYEYRAHKDWSPIRQELKRASITVSDYCWVERSVEGTLLHEMVHQYQSEVLDEPTNHGPSFKSFCRAIEKEWIGMKLR